MRSIPVSVFITWPIPNYVNPPTQGYANLVVNVICMAIVIPLVGLRLFARWHMRKWIGWDDFFCALAVVFAVALSLCVIIANYVYDCNRHIWDIPLDLLEVNLKIVMTTKALFTVAGTCIRQSLLFFYLRLIGEAGMKKFRWAIHFTTFVNLAIGIAFICLTVFQCTPISAYWKTPSDQYGTCLDEGIVTFVCGLIVTVVDICVVMLPVPIVARLQMSLRQKVGVICLLTLGLIAAVAAILRTYYIYKAVIGSYDETWYAYPLWMIAVIETDLAILASCAPALRPFIIKYAPWVLIPFQFIGSILVCKPFRRSSRDRRRSSGTSLKGDTYEATDYENSTVLASSEDSECKKQVGGKKYNGEYRSIETPVERKTSKGPRGGGDPTSRNDRGQRLSQDVKRFFKHAFQPDKQTHRLPNTDHNIPRPERTSIELDGVDIGRGVHRDASYLSQTQVGSEWNSDLVDGGSLYNRDFQAYPGAPFRTVNPGQRRSEDKEPTDAAYGDFDFDLSAQPRGWQHPLPKDANYEREEMDIRAALEAAVPKRRFSEGDGNATMNTGSTSSTGSTISSPSIQEQRVGAPTLQGTAPVYVPSSVGARGSGRIARPPANTLEQASGSLPVKLDTQENYFPPSQIHRSHSTESTPFYNQTSHTQVGAGQDVRIPIVQRSLTGHRNNSWRPVRTTASMPYPLPSLPGVRDRDSSTGFYRTGITIEAESMPWEESGELAERSNRNSMRTAGTFLEDATTSSSMTSG